MHQPVALPLHGLARLQELLPVQRMRLRTLRIRIKSSDSTANTVSAESRACIPNSAGGSPRSRQATARAISRVCTA
jgi:hypothetical protein